MPPVVACVRIVTMQSCDIEFTWVSCNELRIKVIRQCSLVVVSCLLFKTLHFGKLVWSLGMAVCYGDQMGFLAILLLVD